MPRADYLICKSCDRPSSEVGPLSHQRLCAECGERRQTENYEQLQSGSGPFSEHWENRLVMAIARRQVKRLRAS